jgi:hypothetical protein
MNSAEFFKTSPHLYYVKTDDKGNLISANDLFHKQAVVLNNESYQLDRFTDNRGAWIIRSASDRAKRTGHSIAVVVPRRTHDGQFIVSAWMIGFLDGELNFIGFDFLPNSTDPESVWIALQSKFLREIAWMMSHLVRNHVANIIGVVGLIDTDDLNEKNQQLFGFIEHSADGLDKAVRYITYITSQSPFSRPR